MELKAYRADLPLHTVLSPCGDLYMSPSAIIEQAKKLHLDVIAICDHNTTRQVKVAQKIGRDNGILVKDLVPNAETIEQSNDDGLPVLQTSLPTYEIAGLVYNLLH